MFVSIIIPVYNNEAQLDRSIKSVLSQTYSNFELIIVNDGSRDTSGQICDKYANSDPRVIVIHKNNGGVSSARNAALDVAKGDYIVFVDSDDYVSPMYVENMVKANDGRKEVGLIVGGYISVDDDGQKINAFNNRVFKENQIITAIEEINLCKKGYPWAKLYDGKTIRLNKLRFCEQVHYSEDMVFMLTYLKYCKWILFIDKADYYYARNTGGTLINKFHPYENEIAGFDNFNHCLNDLANIHHTSIFNMPNSLAWLSFFIIRSVMSLYRFNVNNNKIGNRLCFLKEHITSEHVKILRATTEKWTGVNKMISYLICRNQFILLDFFLTVLYKHLYRIKSKCPKPGPHQIWRLR